MCFDYKKIATIENLGISQMKESEISYRKHIAQTEWIKVKSSLEIIREIINPKNHYIDAQNIL